MTARSESRLLPLAAVAAVVAVMTILPGRYRLLPPGVDGAIGLAIMAVIAASGATRSRRWANLERNTVFVFGALAVALAAFNLARLLHEMTVDKRALDALPLLSTSVCIWLANVVVFALIYWQLDRDGPYGRTHEWHGAADFSFARGEPEDGVPADWMPAFADYLFLGFTTSTAFSPTDALPLTARAKILMMTQSSISLVTIVAVAARAINILS